jgi:transglutaminase-like putative cysteine protease
VIYDIRHVTTYAYESPVSFARCSLRLEPKSGDGQHLVSHAVDIRPRPADRTIRQDFFGTHTESILIETPHRHLRIDSRSRVSVSRHAPARTAESPEWEGVREVAFEATSLGPASPVGYVFASPLVPVQRPVTAYAAASFAPGGGILAGAVDLMHRIRTDFKYDPKATVISTPLDEVFEKRHGVCQDFAHVMIAGLRGLGLPAAYVSGYLRTIPPPGKPRLQGAMPGFRCGAASRSAGSDSIRPTISWSRTITSCWRWDGIFPMSRRSTASSSDRAGKSSAWQWMCCWWNDAGPQIVVEQL